MTRRAERTSITARRAIANLLRLADADLRDARVVMRGGSFRNAGMLLQSAVTRMAAAALISERGWTGTMATVDTDRLAEANPVKARLQALEDAADRAPALRPDGEMPPASPDGALQDGIQRAGDVLHFLSEHFDVAFDGDEPAGDASPLRLAPSPKPTEPPGSRPTPKAASRKPLLTCASASDTAAASARIVTLPPAKPPVRVKARPSKSEDTLPPAALPVAPVPIAASKPVASTVFWGLMDRWGVADLDALALLGHAGGLSQKGTRPRFKLTGAENDRMAQLQDIDAVLHSLGLDASAWLAAPLAAAPFSGTAPMTFMIQSQAGGVHDLRQYLLNQGLQLSLGKS